MPNLLFRVERIEPAPYAAVPTLLLQVQIHNTAGDRLEGVTLNTQVRIAAAQRPYSDAERERLIELFGTSAQWGAVKSVLWAHSVVHVPPFDREAVVAIPVTCTYDFEVVSAKYCHGLEEGEIPLELLFSGTMLFQGRLGALQIQPIPWDKEARAALPVALWKGLMDAYFPNSAWLRVQRDWFERLYRYRTRKGLLTWEAVLHELLGEVEEARR